MIYLLSKEHYCYKIHTSLAKSSAYTPSPILPSTGNPLYGFPHLYKKILLPSFMIFQICQPQTLNLKTVWYFKPPLSICISLQVKRTFFCSFKVQMIDRIWRWNIKLVFWSNFSSENALEYWFWNFHYNFKTLK